jgi:PAS domain S-box-containing protein
MEDDLAHERDLLHTLMNNIPDQIYFKDRQSRFTRVNTASARALGVASPDEVVGRSDFEFHPEDLSGEYYTDEQQLMASGEPVIGKLEAQRTPGGEERWLSTTKVPIRDREGTVIGIAGISRDVTDRIEVEERLRKTAAELARSNEELQQFAYVASHDLQEPLRMVASYTQLLARRYRDRLDEDGIEFIDFAVDGATRMQNLIQDLLAYSRVGTRTNAFDTLALGEVVKRALSNLRIALEESGAEVTYDGLPTITGDSSQLVQLFQNLLGNALKFRGSEAPRVQVSAERSGNEWIIRVRDNGIGIEPAYAERIFVIFQRLHAKDEYPGSGIGLAICKKIVSRHGGRIWVEPAPERGTVFSFTLPVDKRPVTGTK